MLYKVVLTVESVDAILKCYHSNESYWAALSCGTVYYSVKCDLRFCFRGYDVTSVAVLSQCAIFFSRLRFLFNFAACYFPKYRFKLSNEEGLFESKNKQLTKDCFTYSIYGISTVILKLEASYLFASFFKLFVFCFRFSLGARSKTKKKRLRWHHTMNRTPMQTDMEFANVFYIILVQ